MVLRVLLIGLLSLAPETCGTANEDVADVPPAGNESYRGALFNSLYSSDTLHAVVGEGLDQQSDYQRWLRQGFFRRQSQAYLNMLPAASAPEEVLRRGPVLLAGTPSTNPWLAQLPPDFPAAFDDEGFTFDGTRYTDPAHAVALTHPNPFNPAAPMILAAGNSTAAVAAALRTGNLRGFDYQVTKAGERIRLGRFSASQPYPWPIDPKQDFNLENNEVLVRSSSHFRILAPENAYADAFLDSLTGALERTFSEVDALMPAPMAEDAIDYILYPSVQNKGVRTQNMDLAHLDADASRIHAVVTDGMHGEARGMDIRLLLQRELGTAALASWEEGLAIELAGKWNGLHPLDWAGRLARAGLLPSLSDLLNPDAYLQISPLLREPAAAAFVALLQNEWGEAKFISQYTSWKPGASSETALQQRWDQHVAELEQRPFAPPPLKMLPGFQKGFNFAHEGYGIVNGYGSMAARESLGALNGLGVNAVSVIPYSFMRNPNQATPLNFFHSVGGENDEAVAHAGLAAQQTGLTAMLKPQIWIRGSWPGDIQMDSPEAWTQFYTHYEEWLGHYAVLAEIYGFDALCVGTELSKATMNNEAWWIDFVGRLRHVYSGPITYASNWGEEFESLTFWEAFDYIGVDSYYPLTDQDAPSDRDLRAGAKRVAERIRSIQEQFDMPLLITELGFPSTPMPWKEPHKENRSAGPQPEHQARAYAAMLDALGQPEWLHGMYWWKWPSYLSHGGAAHRGFTPNGKPAASVIERYFSD